MCNENLCDFVNRVKKLFSHTSPQCIQNFYLLRKELESFITGHMKVMWRATLPWRSHPPKNLHTFHQQSPIHQERHQVWTVKKFVFWHHPMFVAHSLHQVERFAHFMTSFSEVGEIHCFQQTVVMYDECTDCYVLYMDSCSVISMIFPFILHFAQVWFVVLERGCVYMQNCTF